MDIRDLLRALRRHWWLVITAVVGAAGLGAAVTELTVPQYATRMTFFVTTPSQGVTDAYQGGLFSQQRVKSYADLLTGDRLAGAVAAEPGMRLTASQIQARLSATAVPDTVLLQATVTDRSRARSQRVAEATARHFIALVQSLETPPGARTPSVKVEVVAGPALDPVPVTPRPVRNLALAAVLGLLVGAGGAALRELRDSTVKTVEVLQQLTSAPVLAVVPFDSTAKKAPLIVEDHAQSSRAEAFRRLRTNLQFVDVDRPVKVIVVTSAVPEEGKSTTAVNLAIAFAEAGKRVLLVEADLRRPRVAHYLGLEGAVGLSNVLAGQVELEEVLQKWGRRELFVLPSGFTPPNPSELLGSRNMQTLLATQREAFDVTIIDTPPLLPVTDAAVVAASADGAVLVTRSGKTAQASVKTAADALEAVDARLLGGLLNMQAGGRETGYYYQSYRPKRDTPTMADIERRDAKHAAPAEPVRSAR